MAMFFAQPKWASTRFMSCVQNATVIVPPLLMRPLMRCSRRTTATCRAFLCRLAPVVRPRLVCFRHEHIGDFEKQIARAAIAHRHLMRRAEAVEHGDAHAQEGQAQP